MLWVVPFKMSYCNKMRLIAGIALLCHLFLFQLKSPCFPLKIAELLLAEGKDDSWRGLLGSYRMFCTVYVLD